MSPPESTSAPAAPAGLRNFRDLGGLSIGTGGRIRHGALYRSDAPMTGDPPPAHAAWPPRTVIDLRSEDELHGEHPWASAATEVVANPLFARASIEHMRQHPEALPKDLSTLYRELLDAAPPGIPRAVGLIAERSGPTLVHCTAGKDRTGIVIAIVLSAIGVADEQIVADYVLTATNMPAVIQRMRARIGGAGDGEDHAPGTIEGLRPEILAAPALAIEAALDELGKAGGGAPWLLARGLPEATLVQLRDRLIVA
jgi:hypothetical protein